jgi:TPR repeat protein
MNLAHSKWLSAVLFTVLALLPWSASAGMTPEEVKAFEGFKVQAEKGDANAQSNLGHCYASGRGVAKDGVQAVKWYRKAADQGYAAAQFNLGLCYFNGEGVAKDFVQAVSWYRKAAEQGNASAQYNLGVCYAKGEGVAKDEIEAYAYWNLAGITDEDARKNLAILEKKMSRDEIASGQQRTKQLQKEIEAKMAGK